MNKVEQSITAFCTELVLLRSVLFQHMPWSEEIRQRPCARLPWTARDNSLSTGALPLERMPFPECPIAR